MRLGRVENSIETMFLSITSEDMAILREGGDDTTRPAARDIVGQVTRDLHIPDVGDELVIGCPIRAARAPRRF